MHLQTHSFEHEVSILHLRDTRKHTWRLTSGVNKTTHPRHQAVKRLTVNVSKKRRRTVAVHVMFF